MPIVYMAHEKMAQMWFVRTALAYLGTPYVWGGDDPSGFDCSGFVLECLKSAGLVGESEDYTADGLLRLFEGKVVDGPIKGGLLFYLNSRGRATHVTICLDEYFQIGASGGGSTTKDASGAWRDNAFVKIRPIRFDALKMRVVRVF